MAPRRSTDGSSDDETGSASPTLVWSVIGFTFFLGVGLIVGGFAFGGGGNPNKPNPQPMPTCDMSSCDGIEGQGKGECQAAKSMECCEAKGTPTALCCDGVFVDYGYGIMVMTPKCNGGCDMSLSRCEGLQGQGMGECLAQTRVECCLEDESKDHKTCCAENVDSVFYPHVEQCRECDMHKCDSIEGQGKGECQASVSMACCEADETPVAFCCEDVFLNFGYSMMAMTPKCTEGCDLSGCANVQGQGIGECLGTKRVACCVEAGGDAKTCCKENVHPGMYAHTEGCRDVQDPMYTSTVAPSETA